VASGKPVMLPEDFVKRMAFRPTLAEVMMQEPLPTALRLNPLKKAALPWKLAPVPWCPTGFYVPPEIRPGIHPLHDAGAYYLQEASAMGPVEALAVEPGMTVADLCAAPGGKSSQIAGKLQHTGFLLSNEIVPTRARLLSRQLERLGVREAVVTCEHPQNLAEHFGAVFDRVLVDAPCSGEGMFRKDPNAAREWTEESNAICAQRQSMILDSAAELVKPGGRLVYSTCTFSPLENEENAKAFLLRHPDFEPAAVSLPGWEPGLNGETHCARLWPDTAQGEGHFLAAFVRNGGEEDPWPCADIRTVKAEFWAGTMAEEMPPLLNRGQYWITVPRKLPAMKGIKVERDGVAVGTYQKGIFKPEHSLVMAYEARQRVELSSTEIVQYLQGMELKASGQGWTACTVDNLALGWGKASQGRMKNHLPSGLRRAWKVDENETHS